MVKGTAYTKCVYTFPVTTLEQDYRKIVANLPLLAQTYTQMLTGTVYTECVYTVPVTTLKPVNGKSVYIMCIHRSCQWVGSQIIDKML